MPIRSIETRQFPASIHELFADEAVFACNAVEATVGFNPMHAAEWWEYALSALLGGQVTPHNAEHDIELGGGRDVEVKFSRAFEMAFGAGKRRVFRWAKVAGSKGAKRCPATIFIGLDRETVHAWVVPRWAIEGANTVTINVPGARNGAARSGLAAWSVPAIDLLPAVLRACESRAP